MSVGDDVVVIGTGSIGMYCLIVARAAGAGRLIAVDVSDFALKTARSLGATYTVNPGQFDAKAAISAILPEGPDLVIEAAGPISAVKLMVSLLRRGTRWNVFGITTHQWLNSPYLLAASKCGRFASSLSIRYGILE